MKKISFPRGLSLISILCLTAFVNSSLGAPIKKGIDRSRLPAALQTVPLDRLSSGAIALLNHGELVRPTISTETASDAAAAVVLDLRVAPNIRLGDDPSGLPPGQRAQAEPHIARSPADPDFLAGVFQEGRYAALGGAVDCGYSISHDGGLTWTRALIPQLTTITGGPYFRATDPVAGIDNDDRVFLATEGATDSTFSTGAILVSRSTDGGQTFEAPVKVYEPSDDSLFPDKPWMAVNHFTGANAERILVTWTLFNGDLSPIYRSYSNDHGVTWSAAAPITDTDVQAQGSQPVFMTGGRAAVIYWNFADSGFGGGDAATAGTEEIQMQLSTDGGNTFGSVKTVVSSITRYEPPTIRTGVFLPSAVSDNSGGLHVVYQALNTSFQPRIFYTKSTDAGTTWTTPIAVTDNLGTGVFNAAIAASANGQTLTVVFYDQRDSGGNTNLCNLYLAQSFDGGATWQPNIRLTNITTNASLAPLTDEGYMLGDYLGVAETTTPDVPAVPIWVDTRTGNPDPFVTRVGVSPEVDFTSFQASRLSLAQINDPKLGGITGDSDGDGESNLSEFLSQTEPNDADSVIHLSRQLNISTRLTVETGDNVLIGGFIITGNGSKQVLLRGIGPSLGEQGISDPLMDPILQLHDGSGNIIATNDNWRDTQKDAIEATTIPPDNDRESAIVATLDPGQYTAVLTGKNNTTGTALVEAYDLDQTDASQYANISTRGLVGTDQDVLIGGVIVGSENAGQANVVVRALGPSLASHGVTNALQDPTLEVHDNNGSVLAANDDWQTTQGGIIDSTGLAPVNMREAAIFITLKTGSYTAVVRGKNNTTGVGLVEVFNIP